MYLVVGLGNPGEEYENTRHNTGWIVLDFILGKKTNWIESGKAQAFFCKNSDLGKPVEFIKPTTFMNNSGVAVLYAKNNHKLNPQKDIIVIHDDIDLPLGRVKFSFNKSSGGHNGVESIIKKLKTKEFLRVRVGVSQATPSGKIKKPKDEKAMLKFLLGEFKDSELVILKKLSKKIKEAISTAATEGKDKAMSLYN